MPKLKEREHKMKYYFTGDNGQKMQKCSGDSVSEGEIKLYDIPNYLLEQPFKNKEKIKHA